MKRVTPIRENATGRLDVLVSRLAEETFRLIMEPRSKELWNVFQPHVQAAVAKQVRRLGVSRRPFTAAELKLIEEVLSPTRRFKCTA